MLYTTLSLDIVEKGYVSIADGGIGGWFSHLLVPWLVLGIYGSTQYTRFSRGAMVESLSEDYIRTAKAKGLPGRTVVYKHALRSALVPVRSEEHTSELQSLMRNSYAVFCFKKKIKH